MMNGEGYLSLFRQWKGVGYRGIRFHSLLMLLTNSIQIHSNIRVQSNRDIKKLVREKKIFGLFEYFAKQ